MCSRQRKIKIYKVYYKYYDDWSITNTFCPKCDFLFGIIYSFTSKFGVERRGDAGILFDQGLAGEMSRRIKIKGFPN